MLLALTKAPQDFVQSTENLWKKKTPVNEFENLFSAHSFKITNPEDPNLRWENMNNNIFDKCGKLKNLIQELLSIGCIIFGSYPISFIDNEVHPSDIDIVTSVLSRTIIEIFAKYGYQYRKLPSSYPCKCVIRFSNETCDIQEEAEKLKEFQTQEEFSDYLNQNLAFNSACNFGLDEKFPNLCVDEEFVYETTISTGKAFFDPQNCCFEHQTHDDTDDEVNKIQHFDVVFILKETNKDYYENLRDYVRNESDLSISKTIIGPDGDIFSLYPEHLQERKFCYAFNENSKYVAKYPRLLQMRFEKYCGRFYMPIDGSSIEITEYNIIRHQKTKIVNLKYFSVKHIALFSFLKENAEILEIDFDNFVANVIEKSKKKFPQYFLAEKRKIVENIFAYQQMYSDKMDLLVAPYGVDIDLRHFSIPLSVKIAGMTIFDENIFKFVSISGVQFSCQKSYLDCPCIENYPQELCNIVKKMEFYDDIFFIPIEKLFWAGLLTRKYLAQIKLLNIAENSKSIMINPDFEIMACHKAKKFVKDNRIDRYFYYDRETNSVEFRDNITCVFACYETNVFEIITDDGYQPLNIDEYNNYDIDIADQFLFFDYRLNHKNFCDTQNETGYFGKVILTTHNYEDIFAFCAIIPNCDYLIITNVIKGRFSLTNNIPEKLYRSEIEKIYVVEKIENFDKNTIFIPRESRSITFPQLSTQELIHAKHISGDAVICNICYNIATNTIDPIMASPCCKKTFCVKCIQKSVLEQFRNDCESTCPMCRSSVSKWQ